MKEIKFCVDVFYTDNSNKMFIVEEDRILFAISNFLCDPKVNYFVVEKPEVFNL